MGDDDRAADAGRPTPPRRYLRAVTATGAPQPARLIPVKGVGRHGTSRRYCDGCRHPVGRCTCRDDLDPAA